MNEKQALVIGLGQFGAALARTLTATGAAVLAVDRSPQLVQAISGHVAEAACFDATDPNSLRRTAPATRDLCVVAVGSDAGASAIIVTALLREMGAKRVVARATDDLTERILRAVGAHLIVHPEREFGARLAPRLLHDSIVEEVPLGTDLVITEIRPPNLFIGRTLAELDLPRHEFNVVAVRVAKGGNQVAIMPDERRVIDGDDILVVVARPNTVRRYLERL